jgi:hypothetical protein
MKMRAGERRIHRGIPGLELIAAHTVVGSNQPFLEVANCAVRQRHTTSRLCSGRCGGVGSGAQLSHSRKLLRPSVYRVEPCAAFCLRNVVRVTALKFEITAIHARPVAPVALLDSDDDECRLPAPKLLLPSKPA